MAGVKGTGGKSFQDRELAARVRTLALTEIESILKRKKMDRFKEAVILKLAGTVLPRLNEHTGADGAELPAPIINVQPHNGHETGNGTE
jgi:hypothetical protein